MATESRLAGGPSGVETMKDQLERLVDGHEFILTERCPLARAATDADDDDDGTNDLVNSQLVRVNELQSWFVGWHLSMVEVATLSPKVGSGSDLRWHDWLL